MKRIKIILSIILTTLLTTNCKHDLLDTTPYSSIGSGNMWTTEALSDLGVIGVYQTLRYDMVGLNRYYLDQDGFTSMHRNPTALTSGNITATDGLFTNYWKQNYEGIHRANDAIVNLQNIAPLTDEKKGRLVAECKFLRALFYFNLNQVFKGVPIYLEPIGVTEATKGRETEEKVWDIIIEDLTDCVNEPHLPDFYGSSSTEYGRATKAAAYALRGKAYMYLKNYTNAETDLRKVGELGPQLYQGTYKELFNLENEHHPEMIFSVQNVAEAGLGSESQHYVGPRSWNNAGFSYYMPHPDFVDSFENKDGSTFNWDDYLPGYNSMSPTQRIVFFLRDGLTNSEIDQFTNLGADMTQYLSQGNEERIKIVYENRDPRLTQIIITPYSTYNGSYGLVDYTYTWRFPYRGFDTKEPFDLRIGTRDKFHYLYRKWVYEGNSVLKQRDQGPTDQPLIRYADIILLLAEAINEQGFDEEAIELVNSVRLRAGAIALQSSDASAPTFVGNQDDMRNRIRNERRWELAFEGINLFDEMRWQTWKEMKFYEGNGTKEIWGTVLQPYSWRGDYLYTWAIPQTETEMNNNIHQNEGWIN